MPLAGGWLSALTPPLPLQLTALMPAQQQLLLQQAQAQLLAAAASAAAAAAPGPDAPPGPGPGPGPPAPPAPSLALSQPIQLTAQVRPPPCCVAQNCMASHCIARHHMASHHIARHHTELLDITQHATPLPPRAPHHPEHCTDWTATSLHPLLCTALQCISPPPHGPACQPTVSCGPPPTCAVDGQLRCTPSPHPLALQYSVSHSAAPARPSQLTACTPPALPHFSLYVTALAGPCTASHYTRWGLAPHYTAWGASRCFFPHCVRGSAVCPGP